MPATHREDARNARIVPCVPIPQPADRRVGRASVSERLLSLSPEAWPGVRSGSWPSGRRTRSQRPQVRIERAVARPAETAAGLPQAAEREDEVAARVLDHELARPMIGTQPDAHSEPEVDPSRLPAGAIDANRADRLLQRDASRLVERRNSGHAADRPPSPSRRARPGVPVSSRCGIRIPRVRRGLADSLGCVTGANARVSAEQLLEPAMVSDRDAFHRLTPGTEILDRTGCIGG